MKTAFSGTFSFFSGLRKKYPITLFMLSFMVLFLLTYRLFHASAVIRYLHPGIIHITALLPYLIINGFGENISFVNNSMLVSPVFTLKIIIDCCAIEPIIIFTSAVVSFPSSLKKKILGILIAIPVFLILNIFRIVSLYYVGANFSIETMDRLHLDVWQVILILISITFFLIWLKWQPLKKSSRI